MTVCRSREFQFLFLDNVFFYIKTKEYTFILILLFTLIISMSNGRITCTKKKKK